MLEIAHRNGLTDMLPFTNVEEARAAYQFHNLQSFLDMYYLGCAVLTTQQVVLICVTFAVAVSCMSSAAHEVGVAILRAAVSCGE